MILKLAMGCNGVVYTNLTKIQKTSIKLDSWKDKPNRLWHIYKSSCHRLTHSLHILWNFLLDTQFHPSYTAPLKSEFLSNKAVLTIKNGGSMHAIQP